jgi:hypothetical protein
MYSDGALKPARGLAIRAHAFATVNVTFAQGGIFMSRTCRRKALGRGMDMLIPVEHRFVVVGHTFVYGAAR